MPLSIELRNSPVQTGHPLLAQLAFGASGPDAVDHPGLRPLSRATAYENWFADTPRSSGQNGAVRWQATAHIMFGSAAVALDGDATRITYDLYSEIFACTRSKGFGHLLRVWHYLPRINEGGGDREHYKRFCLGRAQAFDEWFDSSLQLPAGTAIGTRSGNVLQIYFLASDRPGQQLENPRQVSAFRYPRQYGPRNPKFSRAVVYRHAGAARLLISGTASIVGHESRHEGNLQGQLQETWLNMECLRDGAGAHRPLALRVYIRHQADYPEVRAFLEQRLDADTAVLYLHADICRAELLVEIEGVYDIPQNTANSAASTISGGTRQ